MTTQTISNISMRSAMRFSANNAQAELEKAKREVTTGIHDDLGTELGARMSHMVNLSNELDRIKNNKDTNSIVIQRLDSSQTAMDSIGTSAQTILNSLVSLSGNADAKSIKTMTDSIKDAYQAITAAANTSVNGEFLFAGINTDVKPLDDYFAAGSPAKTSFDTLLNGYLTANTIASVSAMTATQMTDFINNTLTPSFMGTDWTTNWSSATDKNLTGRVTNNQIIETSTNTNSSGFRQMALAMVISTELLSKTLATDVRQAASTAAISAIGLGRTGIDAQRTQLGLSQSRVSEANDFLDAQRNILEKYLSSMQSIDPYEASSRVEELKTLLQTAYSLTAHLQNLSLVNFL